MAKQFNLVLLGYPASGKTAFLAMLAKACHEAVAPAEAQGAVKHSLEALERGEALPPTRDGKADSWTFKVNASGAEPALNVATRDYAGELTRSLNDAIRTYGLRTNAARELQRDIHRSEGILLMVDCVSMKRAGGWLAWCDARVMHVLKLIREVLSDTRRHPLVVLLTRSDLVTDDFATTAESDVTATLKELVQRPIPGKEIDGNGSAGVFGRLRDFRIQTGGYRCPTNRLSGYWANGKAIASRRSDGLRPARRGRRLRCGSNWCLDGTGR